MKLIQAMKRLKDLNGKAEDLRKKVAQHHANLSIETSPYPNPREQVDSWIQGHGDVLKEILSLRVALQRTNLATPVTIELGGKQVTKTIAEWIHRRRDLAKLDMAMWQGLSDKGLRDQTAQASKEGPPIEIKVVRHYDVMERDKHLELYRTEPSIIDATLEVVNATTDLLE